MEWLILAVGVIGLGLGCGVIIKRGLRPSGLPTGPGEDLDGAWESYPPLVEAATALGLTYSPAEGEARGEVRQLEVRCRLVVTDRSDPDERVHLRAWLDGSDKLPRGVTVIPAHLQQTPLAQELAVAQQTVTLGDAEFDRHFTIIGEEPEVFGCLSSEVREGLTAAKPALMIRDANWVWQAPLAATDPSGAFIVAGITALASASFGLYGPLDIGSVARQLVFTVVSDPANAVRLRCLVLLQEHFPDSPHTAEANRIALEEPDSEYRLAAARGLGEEGIDMAIGIFENRRARVESRVEAFEYLSEQLPPAKLRPLLGRVLRGGDEEIRLALMSAMAAPEDAWPAKSFRSLIAEVGLERAVFLACGYRGLLPGHEEAELIALLSDDNYTTRRMAVHILRRVGSVEAVEPLFELAKGTSDTFLMDDARAAVSAIQDALAGAGAGQLSVASDSETGSISIAGDPGAISVTGEAGALSASDEEPEEPV